jgi:DNA repair exonuclease SbcCD ATPase subunit
VSTILDWLTPWYVKAALVAVVLGILAYGVHSYNTAVSAKAVTAALKKERAEKQPIIDELAMRVANADKTITDYKAASDKLKAKIESNQGVLNATLKKLENSNRDLANLRGTDAEFKRLLDSATANTGSASSASTVTRLEQLTSAHYQCQREFREERSRHAKTIAGLEQAIAVIDALKN